MKKTVILSLTLFIILCSSAGQMLFSFSSYTPTRTIASFGNITAKHARAILAEGVRGTDTVAREIATFDLAIVGWTDPVSFGNMIHNYNSKCKVYAYFDIIGAGSGYPENAYMHTITGARIQSQDWGWYLMNPLSPEWQAAVAQRGSQIKDAGCDGVFADDATHFVPLADRVPDLAWWQQVQSDGLTRWQQGVRGLLQLLKQSAGSVIYNDLLDIYLDVADGQTIEGFAFGGWGALNYLSAVEKASRQGKVVVPITRNVAPTHDNFLFAFAWFLMGLHGGDPYMCWQDIWRTPYYYSEMDYYFGEPLGDYTVQGDVCTRLFRNGAVQANLSTKTAVISYTPPSAA